MDDDVADAEALRPSLKRVAAAEGENAAQMSIELVKAIGETGRWQLASLIVLNGGAMVALSRLGVPIGESGPAFLAYLVGIVLALLTAEVSIFSGQRALKSMMNWRGMMIACEENPALELVDLHQARDEWSKMLKPVRVLTLVVRGIGYLSVIAFIIGCVLAADLVNQAAPVSASPQ